MLIKIPFHRFVYWCLITIGYGFTGAKRSKVSDPLLLDVKPLNPKVGVSGSKGGRIPPKILNDPKTKFRRQLPIIKEESIAVEELGETPIPTQIEEMGWGKLVAKPQRINLSVMYELYNRIDSETFMTQGVKVRGISVPFNPIVLNEYFGTPTSPEDAEYFPPNNQYFEDIPTTIAKDLRKYPLGK